MYVYRSHNKETHHLFLLRTLLGRKKYRIVRWRRCNTQRQHKKIKDTFSLTLRREETSGDEKRVYVRVTLNWILNKLDMRVFLLESSAS